MVAIKGSEFERIISRDVGSYSAFLVHGSDVGLVSERIRRIVKAVVDDPADPFQLVRLTGDDLARDTPRLSDEARTMPLFGGRRAVLVESGGKNIAAAVELFLETASPCPVVIEAGALKRDAPLRRAVERSRFGAAIECFPDGEREVASLIDAEIAAAGLGISADAKQRLASLLGADRMASRSEIVKLLLYAHGTPSIAVEDVEAAVADASVQAFDTAIDAAFSGDTATLDDAIRKLHLGATDAGQLLGTALRHAVMLQRGKLSGPGDAGGGFRGGVSPRRKVLIERQTEALSHDILGRTIVRLGEAIQTVRTSPRLAQDHAARALWTIALAARPKRGR